MNSKTPAELQVEMLRKLKQQQSSRPPKPVEARTAAAKPAFEVKPAKAKSRRRRVASLSLPLNKKTWEALKAKFGISRPSKAMGELAAQLLLALPKESLSSEPAMHRELTKALRDWCDSRYMK